ncbi:hypothetical protein Rhe02_44370 [Rhizocola hellebori]|uniref:Uncharacterized protein n=1 Tax=Rhizocola hellebori TaxID=1392758 RepID=A0A8J3VHC6_9ACTN|nr:hypothetical protein [Rhizocola hellebori]GIH06370.1 hypothetical protein Rhe02_44370 [Rhizocola hellebori]
MLREALDEANNWIGKVPGVVMVGEGRAQDGSPTVDVWVTQPVSLPQKVKGVEVRVRNSGDIQAQ